MGKLSCRLLSVLNEVYVFQLMQLHLRRGAGVVADVAVLHFIQHAAPRVGARHRCRRATYVFEESTKHGQFCINCISLCFLAIELTIN